MSNVSRGRIVTFYSFKGGTGRSMILANIAWILASNGKRVLAVDWDLEAPGLHRYFEPFLLDRNLENTEGLIEFFDDFMNEALTLTDGDGEGDEDWYIPFTNIMRFAISLDAIFPEGGTLDFVPAGQQNHSYSMRVNSFNWQRFYERHGGGGFLDAVKAKMRIDYDYILIDSRTGVSDTSGVCTIQMPDVLVILFTPNNQSILGAASVAASVVEQWGMEQAQGECERVVFPILTRVERAEKDKLDLARRYARTQFDKFLMRLSTRRRDEYWGRVEVPHDPWYAYEELLATFRDDPHQRDSLLTAIENIAAYVTRDKVNRLVPPDEKVRAEVLRRFARRPIEELRKVKTATNEKSPVGEVAIPFSEMRFKMKSQDLRSLPDDESPLAGFPVHNLPFESLGSLFKGRGERLQALAGSPDQPTAIIQKQKQAIHGLGGIGKTRLAIEYAWQYGSHYEAILFVPAGSPEKLRSNLAALARANLLNLPEWKERDEQAEYGAVLRWLRQNPDWLLILDNVDTEDAAQAVDKLLPVLTEGHVLVTSRLSRWSAIREQFLDTISPEAGRDFLLERTEGKREPATDDADQARELAETLGGLPLALQQAAAYIAYHHLSFAEYRAEWAAERARVLEWYDSREMQYPASVAVTWQRILEQLEPASRTILRLAAFLAPDPIPVAMLEGAGEIASEALASLCEETGQSPAPLRVKDALGDLAAYSMITWEGKAFSVHRMVQEVMRSRIPEERKPDWVKWSLRVVDAYAPGDPADVRTWPLWDLIRPHVGQCIEHAEGAGIAEPTSRLMNDLGALLDAKAVYTEAEPLYRRALLIDESFFGAEHPNVARDLNNLAQLLQATNRLEEAEPLMRRALLIDESSFGAEHPNVARDLNNLAQLLQASHRQGETEALIRRALMNDESSFGAEHR
ncbi:MAG: tetratricopeptide repeat protein, partial [bacterium]|nr:tetratricopeptide repeat protein [bacterium]